MVLSATLRLPRFRLPTIRWQPRALSLATLLGVAMALATLVVGLGWRTVTDSLQGRVASAGLERRLDRGLVGTAAELRAERSRTLLTAEAAAGTRGLPAAVAAGDSARTLDLLRSARRAAAPALLAVVDRRGRILAADPATNLPLATTFPVKQAASGQAAVGVLDGAGTLSLVAAAPVEDRDRNVGTIVALQPLDDRLLDALEEQGELSAALLLQGRVVAATPAIRLRYSQSHGQPVAIVPPGAPGQPGRLSIGGFRFAVRSEGLFSLGSGRTVTLVVGVPVGDGAGPLSGWRFWLDWGGSLLAAALAGVAGWLVGHRLGRQITGLVRDDDHHSALAGREITELAAALSVERDRARARETSAAAELKRLRAVLDAIQDGIIVSDANRRVILANLAAQRMLGLASGTPDAGAIALLPPIESSRDLQARSRSLHSYSAPLADSGDSAGVVTVLHDATEEQEGERLKSEFLSVVSHELQTPLTAIISSADLLIEGEPGQLTPEQLRFVNAIRRNGHRLMTLVSDLLDVTRLEAGRVELDLQPVDLGVLARSAVRSLANLFEQRSQAVEVVVADGVPPALGDRRRLEQILSNLLANAGQYTPVGSQIRVEVRSVEPACQPGRVMLVVADNGPGISPSDQARIFDKFYRGSAAAARRERGSGLGLSIVRSLVELHGGRIWVESVPGAGTRFTVELPIATAEDE